MPANTSNSQQEANFLEDDDAGNIEEANNPITPESHEQDTGVHHNSPPDCQNQVELDTTPEEEELEMEEQPDPADQDTLVFTSDESEEEPFNTAIDTTSDDPTIVMSKPVTTAFISDQVRIPTEKVGCLQVTSQLQDFLDHFPPKSIEKAFEQIYEILQVLDKYLIDNPHQYCMSPDSKYITLISYTTKLEIDLCNFLAIWVVFSILIDTRSKDLQYVQNLQQVVNYYYDKHTTEAMTWLEQQASEILDVMYDSVTKHNFDSISDNVDRVSDAVDNNSDKIDTDSIKLPYDNDNDITTGSTKNEQNMTDILKDTDTTDKVRHDRDDNTMNEVKWSTETNDIDNQFLREYDNMCRMMEDRQITDYYQAQRHIQSAIMSDSLVKTVQNRQYINNVSDCDSELHRISKSVCHKLDLGPISLPGAQQHTTVETAAALKIQDKTESDFIANMQNNNGQYRHEIYDRAESMIPQLAGKYNVSDSSDIDSHDYLDLASMNIIQYRTRGQKKRQEARKAEYTNRCLANIKCIKPNTGLRKQRQKASDNEDIDMDKIVKDDMPRYAIKRDLKEVLHDRKIATETERQLKEKEAKRLALEKVKRLQTEKRYKRERSEKISIRKGSNRSSY